MMLLKWPRGVLHMVAFCVPGLKALQQGYRHRFVP
jgi:hypothetical protein